MTSTQNTLDIVTQHRYSGWLDFAAVGAAITTLAGWLPPIAALLTIIWTAIRIWETKTVQTCWKKWRRK